MDLESRSKAAKVADEFTSDEYLHFLRDGAGLIFRSTETDTMLILAAHLKGYTRGNIKSDIIEGGTKMVVTCEKPIQETVMIGSKVIKRDVKVRKFSKAFKIPVGVILDQIKTDFNEEASILTITMPKRVNGIPGTGIQEVKEPKLVTQTSSENPPSTADKIPKRETFQDDKGPELSSYVYQKEQVSRETEMQFPGFPSNNRKAHEEVEKHGAKGEVPQRETEEPKAETKSQKNDYMFQETRAHSNEIGDGKLKGTNLKDQPNDDEVCEKANGVKEEEKTGDDLSRTREAEEKLPERRNKICVPLIEGSAVILCIVVFVIHFMRKKYQAGKRKDKI
ncbi:unnamed protein product [Withania somnifera]